MQTAYGRTYLSRSTRPLERIRHLQEPNPRCTPSLFVLVAFGGVRAQAATPPRSLYSSLRSVFYVTVFFLFVLPPRYYYRWNGDIVPDIVRSHPDVEALLVIGGGDSALPSPGELTAGHIDALWRTVDGFLEQSLATAMQQASVRLDYNSLRSFLLVVDVVVTFLLKQLNELFIPFSFTDRSPTYICNGFIQQ